MICIQPTILWSTEFIIWCGGSMERGKLQQLLSNPTWGFCFWSKLPWLSTQSLSASSSSTSDSHHLKVLTFVLLSVEFWKTRPGRFQNQLRTVFAEGFNLARFNLHLIPHPSNLVPKVYRSAVTMWFWLVFFERFVGKDSLSIILANRILRFPFNPPPLPL
jgi:hypothetical protein